MFHSDAFNAPLQIATDLARKTLVSAALQKPHLLPHCHLYPENAELAQKNPKDDVFMVCFSAAR